MRTLHFRKNASWELDTGKKAKGGGRSTSWEVQERLEGGSPNSRGGSKVEFTLRRREGEWGGETGGCLPLLSRYPARGRETWRGWALLGRPPQAATEVSWTGASRSMYHCMYVLYVGLDHLTFLSIYYMSNGLIWNTYQNFAKFSG